MNVPPMMFYRDCGCEVAFVPLSEFKAAAADRDEWEAKVRSLARELLLSLMRNWSEDAWCSGWGYGSDPKAMIDKELELIDADHHPQRKHFRSAAARIREVAELAGGWWVSPTEFKEGDQ